MTNNKHTPGPWTIYPVNNPLPTNGCLIFSGERLLADCNFAPDWLERNANAHLIAAAPDMLAALKQIAAYADSSTDPAIVTAARAAIAKAEAA